MLSSLLIDMPIYGSHPLHSGDGSFSPGESLLFSHTSKTAGTQKARGILFLQENRAKLGKLPHWAVPKHLLFSAGETFEKGSFNFPVFARPCPTVPRHGFVDSIVCKDYKELNALSQSTVGVESEAELLVTKPIDCYYNAIISNEIITFATDNDGATAGRKCNFFYLNDDPLTSTLSIDPGLLLPDEVPFYELVFGKDGTVHLVQVRSAPRVPRVKDYVPQAVRVEKIVKATGDLLTWESLLKTLDPQTTIIDHTDGSLASHYAIHAIINRIPIFTSYLPKLGDTVEATVENSEITDVDKEAFFQAFVVGFNSSEFIRQNIKYSPKKDISSVMKVLLQTSLATLHNFSALSLNKDYKLLGAVMGLFLRVTFSVSNGEARYSNSHLKKNLSKMYPDLLAEIAGKSREFCYETMFEHSAEKAISNIVPIFNIFNDYAWGASFGGKRWAACTRSSINLFNACVNKDIVHVVELFNKVINEEHNGGKYLNKVIDVYDFDRAAQNPSHYALNNLKHIVDVLNNVWTYAANTDAWKQTTEFFKPIELPSTLTIKKVYLYSNEALAGKISTIRLKATVDGQDINYDVKIPTVAVDPAKFLSYVGGDKLLIKLSAIPFYWAFDNEKVLGKKKLVTLFKQNAVIIDP